MRPRIRHALLIPVWAIGLIACPAAAGAAERQKFDSLYGDQVKALNTPAKKAAFAKRLVEDARGLSADPALQADVLRKAHEFGLAAPAGYDAAAEAMRLLGEAQPKRKAEAQDKLLAVLERQFRSAPRDARKAAARKYLDLANALAERDAADGDLDRAASRYQAAKAAADAVGAGAAQELAAKVKDLKARRAAQARADALTRQLADNPKDAAAADELVRLLLVELDDPARAQEYLAAVADPALRRIAPLAANDPAKLKEEELFELAEWYDGRAKGAGGTVRAAALRRAVDAYKRYLALHSREDGTRLKAKLAIEKAERLLAGAGPGPAPVVDLLKRIDLKRDVLGGEWERTPDGLACTGAGPSVRLRIPYDPPEEYDYRVTFTQPNAGQGPLFMVTRAGGGDFYWFIGERSGFGVVDGEDLTVATPGAIKAKRRMTTVVKVRRDAVSAFVDEKRIMEINAVGVDFSNVPQTGWHLGAGCFGLGARQPVVFHSIELIEISGTGRPRPR